jgi:hypothetical protein
MLNRHLAGRQFVASDRYTIADILALVTVNFASRINLAIPEDCSHLRRWHESVSARPSAAGAIPDCDRALLLYLQKAPPAALTRARELLEDVYCKTVLISDIRRTPRDSRCAVKQHA